MRKSYISRGWVEGGGIRNRNISRVFGQLSPQAQGGPGWWLRREGLGLRSLGFVV